MLKTLKQNQTLKHLLISITAIGIIIEIILLLFTKDKIVFTISLWTGIILALASAIHMAYTLDSAMDLGSAGASKHLLFHNIIRYIVIVIIFVLIISTNYMQPLYTFLGIMTLKLGAYLVPHTEKLLDRSNKK